MGSELETTNSTAGFTGHGSNYITIRDVTGIAGQYYDQIAMSFGGSSTGITLKLGVYDDNGDPHNLLASVEQTGLGVGYVYGSITEFALASNKVWLGWNWGGTGTLNYNYNTVIHYYKSVGSYTLPNPSDVLSSYSNQNFCHRMKIKHS